MRYVGKTATILLVNFIVILCSLGAFAQGPLTVTSVEPLDDAVDVSVFADATVWFSAPIDFDTVDNNTMYLTDPLENKVPVTYFLNQTPPSVRMTPIQANLEFGTEYTIHVTTGVQDLLGNSLTSEFTSSFTTAGFSDTDGDGIPDYEDECVNSDLSETVVIDGCDSGVSNTLFENGCTISDDIAKLASDATNHGEFVSSVAHYTNDLKNDGFITAQEKGAVGSCAGQSDMPQ